MTNSSVATVPARLAARAQECPGDVALEVIGVGRLTLEQWDRRSNAVARALVARGVSRGDRIMLPCDSSTWLEYAIAYMGVQKAGATAVPVLRGFGDQHLEWAWASCGAAGAIGEVGGAEIGGWRSLVAVLEAGQSVEYFASRAEPDDVAEITFTSGTTGVPDAIGASHRNLLFTHSPGGSGQEKRVVLHALPPGAVAGQGLMLQPLDAVAHEVVALPHYDDEEFLRAIVRYRVTHVVLVPAFAMSLIRAARRGEFDLSSVKVVRTMSAPITPEALAELDRLFPNAGTDNMYTSTRAWPARTRLRFDPSRRGSVGRSTRAGAVRVVDDDGAEVPAGTAGNVELSLAGAPQRHYIGEQADDGEWVRMGDVGYLDADGYLYLLDRDQDLVNSGGVKVSTIEVEAAILQYPGVIEAAVVGLPHRDLGEYVAAAVRTVGEVDLAALGAFLDERLGPARAPKRIEAVDELPRNPMSKVLKRTLREQLTGGPQVDEEGGGADGAA